MSPAPTKRPGHRRDLAALGCSSPWYPRQNASRWLGERSILVEQVRYLVRWVTQAGIFPIDQHRPRAPRTFPGPGSPCNIH